MKLRALKKNYTILFMQIINYLPHLTIDQYCAIFELL